MKIMQLTDMESVIASIFSETISFILVIIGEPDELVSF